jgi:MoaA/NifB/PqqE/SkfB family radical SAM enzyme
MLHRLLYSPFLAQLVVTRRCNLACGYCNEFDDHSPEVPYDTLVDRIDRLKDLGTFTVELTGGEPMLHPRIYDLVTHARKRSFFRVKMISNAFLLGADRVLRLNDAGLQAMQISVDGVRPNEVTQKTLAPLRKKLETVAKLAEFEVVVSGVLGAAPIEETLEVVSFVRSLGLRPRVLVLHGPDGQSLGTVDDLDRVAEAIGTGFHEARDYRAKLARAGVAPFKCRAGSRYLYVDEHGIVSWCSQTRGTFGVPLERYDRAELERQFHTPKSCSDRCTIGCARTNSAADEWRPQRGVVTGPRRLPVIT